MCIVVTLGPKQVLFIPQKQKKTDEYGVPNSHICLKNRFMEVEHQIGQL